MEPKTRTSGAVADCHWQEQETRMGLGARTTLALSRAISQSRPGTLNIARARIRWLRLPRVSIELEAAEARI